MNNHKPKFEASTGVATTEAMIYSFVFHALILIVVSVGLPGFKKEPIQIAPPITVELVDIDKITQTNKVSAPAKPKDKELEKPKPEVRKPTPPKVDTTQVPDLSKPSEPDIDENENIAPPIPRPEKLADIKKKPKPPPKKPKAPPKKAQASKTKSFDSLLKNLTPDSAEDKKEQAKEDEKPDNQSDKSQIAMLSEKLTISEEDALRRQLGKCWNVPIGSKYAENLIVEVRVTMNPDRTVKQASIMDKGRYNRDSHFKAAADAAVRALHNPRCTPLILPLDKYEEWKTIVINFDPSDML